jgi:hypothetical protein
MNMTKRDETTDAIISFSQLPLLLSIRADPLSELKMGYFLKELALAARALRAPSCLALARAVRSVL